MDANCTNDFDTGQEEYTPTYRGNKAFETFIEREGTHEAYQGFHLPFTEKVFRGFKHLATLFKNNDGISHTQDVTSPRRGREES